MYLGEKLKYTRIFILPKGKTSLSNVSKIFNKYLILIRKYYVTYRTAD